MKKKKKPPRIDQCQHQELHEAQDRLLAELVRVLHRFRQRTELLDDEASHAIVMVLARQLGAEEAMVAVDAGVPQHPRRLTVETVMLQGFAEQIAAIEANEGLDPEAMMDLGREIETRHARIVAGARAQAQAKQGRKVVRIYPARKGGGTRG